MREAGLNDARANRLKEPWTGLRLDTIGPKGHKRANIAGSAGGNRSTSALGKTGHVMKEFLLQFFTWWNGQTLGTKVFTSRHGEKVGEDEFGNAYYRSKGGRIDRRWGMSAAG